MHSVHVQPSMLRKEPTLCRTYSSAVAEATALAEATLLRGRLRTDISVVFNIIEFYYSIRILVFVYLVQQVQAVRIVIRQSDKITALIIR